MKTQAVYNHPTPECVRILPELLKMLLVHERVLFEAEGVLVLNPIAWNAMDHGWRFEEYVWRKRRPEYDLIFHRFPHLLLLLHLIHHIMLKSPDFVHKTVLGL